GADREPLLVQAQDRAKEEFIMGGIPAAVTVAIDPDAILRIGEEAVGIAIDPPDRHGLAVQPDAALDIATRGDAQRPARPAVTEQDGVGEHLDAITVGCN